MVTLKICEGFLEGEWGNIDYLYHFDFQYEEDGKWKSRPDDLIGSDLYPKTGAKKLVSKVVKAAKKVKSYLLAKPDGQ